MTIKPLTHGVWLRRNGGQQKAQFTVSHMDTNLKLSGSACISTYHCRRRVSSPFPGSSQTGLKPSAHYFASVEIGSSPTTRAGANVSYAHHIDKEKKHEPNPPRNQ